MAKGIRVSDNRVSIALAKSGIDVNTLPPVLTLPIIIHYLRKSRSTLKELQKQHVEFRPSHLYGFAQAVVEAKHPSLTTDKLERRTKRMIQSIIHHECIGRMHRKINRHLYPSHSAKPLSRVDIPASDIAAPFPIGPDPKEWTGPWKSITDPSIIASHVCAANHRQYHQAHDTPLGKDPLLSALGYLANTSISDDIISKSILPDDIIKYSGPLKPLKLKFLIDRSNFRGVFIKIFQSI